ncbi:MAG: DUF1549 domain-containing protein [Planctomycetaceae bacterium]
MMPPRFRAGDGARRPSAVRGALCLVLFATAAWAREPAGGAASADAVVRLDVFPPAVRLDSARDRQRIVVREVLADGRTRDVTGRASCTLLAPHLADVTVETGGLTFRPRAAGTGTIRLEHGAHGVEIPLEVISATSDPPLSFRLDVMPIFARSGCNMGSCHGAARGKDGFRLSLFGFDPAGDYHRITRELPGRRIDLADPAESLLVRKAVGTAPHTGGKRFAPDSDLAATLVRWIAAGAPDDATEVPALVGLDLYPPDMLLEGPGMTQRLVAVARFADGTDRDVTDLVWYGTNNDRAAKVGPDGLVTGGERGEAFVMARYDTITVGTPIVVIPVGLERPVAVAAAPGGSWIDALVDAKLAALRIAPSPPCDDATFLRRVMIDTVGLLPTSAERTAFLADTSADKRSRLVDRLLTRPEFVDLWVMKWADMLQIRSQNNVVSTKGAILYHQWLTRRIAANQPVDQMVRDLLTASGSTFENPPTNYFQLERNTLKLAENVAQAFLGMRIQCAQCHNHPFDRWTMDDYYGFAAFFPQIGRKRGADPRETIVYDAGSGDVKHPVSGRTVAPKFLGGETPRVADRDRREALAAWITAADNPYFSRHVANLAWTHFLGRGIVHEPDDARVSNPPSNAPLLDELGRRLAEGGWDFRGLARDILLSHTYQRSCETTPSNALDGTNFSHAEVRRIRAEVLLDVLAQVTETATKFPGLPQGGRAVQVADGRTTNYFLTTFGRATREDVCTCAVRMDPSLSQALHMLNGDAANDRIVQGKLVPRLLAEGRTPSSIVDELFSRCYCRLPTERERQETVAMVVQAADPKQALEDLFWALLNSPEFVFNH